MKKFLLLATISLMTVIGQAASYYTVSEIMDVYNDLGLSSNTQSASTYTVRGYVTRWYNGYPNYQNADFYIDDSANGSTSRLECFRLTAQLATDKRTLQIGEYVEVTGYLKNYNGRAEVVNGTFRVLPNVYSLTVLAGKGGSVNSEVNGDYTKGTQVTIKATADENFTFLQWSDGNTNATRTITITEDLVLRAEFKGNYNYVEGIIAIYNGLNLANGETSTASYTGRGYVTRTFAGYPSKPYATFYVDDTYQGKTTLYCYQLTAAVEADQRAITTNDYVEFTGKLMNNGGKARVVEGTFRVMEAPKEEEEEDTGCLQELQGLKGVQILEALHEQIKDPDTVTYKDLRADITGIDYRADGYVWDMYSPCDFGPKGYCTTVESPEECSCYNREHMVPQSWWGNNNSKRMRTDLHHVIPADGFTNEKRSNNPYGEVTGSRDWWNSIGTKRGYGTYNTTVFEPIDEYKGDIARVYFYMLTCYYNENFTINAKGRNVFTYVDGKAGLTSEALALFLKWHRNDPVSEKEINRNNGIELLQHNRNPFVDNPELVEYIWGKNATVVYTCKTTDFEAIEEVAPRAKKIIENGALFIVLPDGTRYTSTGARVR